MTVTTVYSLPCPVCQTLNDRHTGADASIPEDGDLSICVSCISFLTYTHGGTKQRALTPEEFDALPEDTRRTLKYMRHKIRQLHATKGPFG